MHESENIPVAYLVTHQTPACEIACVYDVENENQEIEHEVIWIPASRQSRLYYSQDKKIALKFCINLIKVLCFIVLIVVLIQFFFTTYS